VESSLGLFAPTDLNGVLLSNINSHAAATLGYEPEGTDRHTTAQLYPTPIIWPIYDEYLRGAEASAG